MKKTISRICKKAVENSMKINANSTTSFLCFQPKAPAELKKFSKNAK